MIRLHFLVEGETEEAFVDAVLAPALWPINVYSDACRVSTSRHGSRVRRGGGGRYVRWRNDLLRWMKMDQHSDAWFTTMIDYYGLPTDFPEYTACRQLGAPHARVECLERYFALDINHLRFVPYIQLHEFEAILYSDVSKFNQAFPGRTAPVLELQKARQLYTTVDEIDDGKLTALPNESFNRFPTMTKIRTVS